MEKRPDFNASGFFSVDIPGVGDLMMGSSVAQVEMHESILSPASYTVTHLQIPTHTEFSRNFDSLKSQDINIKTYNPNIFSGKVEEITQKIYKMTDRKPYNHSVQSFSIHSCDITILNNAERRMSNYYQCMTPSMVAAEAFKCVGATRVFIEPSAPARDYQAANIHPFQVLAEQADVALSGGTDPSYLHFTTLLNSGTHYFRSIKEMVSYSPRWKYYAVEEGAGELLGNPYNIIDYSAPCDFDLLSDIMNGVGSGASVITINPFSGTFDLLQGDLTACGGMGGALVNSVITDTGSETNCGTSPENYMSLRQARLSIIQEDKIALKITVPYNPFLHAGDMVECIFTNKTDGTLNYGSGEYLIVNLQHSLHSGGLGITMMDLVSESVGVGIV